MLFYVMSYILDCNQSAKHTIEKYQTHYFKEVKCTNSRTNVV